MMALSLLHRRDITPFDVLALVVGLAVLGDVIATDTTPVQRDTAPVAAPLPIDGQIAFSPTNRITAHPDIPRWVEDLSAYQTWVDGAPYHGVFAVSDDQKFGWVTGYNDPDMARRSALALCARTSESPCRVIARSGPITPIAHDQVPMSDLTARMFAENNARNGFRDFAFAENGVYGYSWGYQTHFEARQMAMAQCNARLVDRPAHLPEVTCRLMEWRKRDLQRAQ